MRYREFMGTGNRTVIGTARRIEAIHQFQPIDQKDMRWLVKLSRDEEFTGKLYWHSQRMNHRSPMQTDHQFLNDAGTCAKAYTILSQIHSQTSYE